jgi:1-acyl-sn-glycerol-3-phosphate acyltransferase
MPAASKAREVPPISGVTLRFFQIIVRRYFKKHFRTVMVQNGERLTDISGALIVYANHSSWWDPMVSLLLANKLLPGCKHYAPMDADALKRYPILRRLGIFPVEMKTARGAAQFLRTSQAILESGGVVWITPQGRFADPRATELKFKPGLGALAMRVPAAKVLPLAIEYTFWDERMPETLLRFGDCVDVHEAANAEDATARLETALNAVMMQLKTASMARDVSAFDVLLAGRRGTGGVYALGRRMRALIAGKKFAADHTDREERDQR